MTGRHGDAAPDRVRFALGLMSGTSLDGIDAAVLKTDGETIESAGAAVTVPYDGALRARLRAALGGNGPVAELSRDLTGAHAVVVEKILHAAGLAAGDIDVIGFHGHTIVHQPMQGRTWQIGDGDMLAEATSIDVVTDFRSADVGAGGEGAPLASLYHAALCRNMAPPVCVLNLGGVGNVTWIGDGGALRAFDTGPGNALLDDWSMAHTGRPYDEDGALALAGAADEAILRRLLADPYFEREPPKSLDRQDFNLDLLAALSPQDGAATLAAFTCRAAALAVMHFPSPPRRWLVTGGGRHNPALMAGLAGILEAPVEPAEAAGWDGDALEAQAFAFLAVRSLRGLPLSLPSTTGVARPMPGGTLYRAR